MKEHISQIFLDDEKSPLPDQIARASSTVHKLFRHHHHNIYRNKQLENFIEKYFEPDVLDAYKSLVPYAYKADLGRYCLIYKLGGWYIDISIMPIRHIVLPDEIDFFYFYDLGHNILLPECQMSDCQNGFFYAKQGHPILKNAINMVVENCKKRNKGITPLCLSGPSLFGRVIANYVPSRGIMHGHFMPLTPYHRRKNMAYVTPSGELAAWHKSAWLPEKEAAKPGLEGLGVNSGNNYMQLWQEGKIFHN